MISTSQSRRDYCMKTGKLAHSGRAQLSIPILSGLCPSYIITLATTGSNACYLPDQCPFTQIPGSPAFKVALNLFLYLTTLEQGSFFYFLSLYWICYSFAPVLCFGFLVMWDLSSLTRDHPEVRRRRRRLDPWMAGRPKVARGRGKGGILFL